MTATITNDTLLERGIQAIQAGDRVLGRDLLKRSIEQGDEECSCWCWLSSIATSLSEATNYLRNALECDPDSEYARTSLVKMLVRGGIEAARRNDRATAIPLFIEANEYEPQNEVALLWRAGFAETPEHGIELLHQVLEVNPLNSRAKEGIAQLEKQIASKSLCFVCQAAVKAQDHTQCRNCRLQVSLDDLKAFTTVTVNKDQVKRVAQDLHARVKQTRDPQAMYNLALCYLNLGYSLEGVKTLKAYSKLVPTDTATQKATDKLHSFFTKRAAAEVTKTSTANAPTVLVVDDSPTIQKLISATLTGIGYQVATVSSADEAINHVRTQAIPKLFVLDVNMPGMDGFQLCKTIRQSRETSKVPVVFLTGKDGFLNKLKGQWVGASEYLIKPFDPKKLVTVIQKLVPVEASHVERR